MSGTAGMSRNQAEEARRPLATDFSWAHEPVTCNHDVGGIMMGAMPEGEAGQGEQGVIERAVQKGVAQGGLEATAQLPFDGGRATVAGICQRPPCQLVGKPVPAALTAARSQSLGRMCWQGRAPQRLASLEAWRR